MSVSSMMMTCLGGGTSLSGLAALPGAIYVIDVDSWAGGSGTSITTLIDEVAGASFTTALTAGTVNTSVISGHKAMSGGDGIGIDNSTLAAVLNTGTFTLICHARLGSDSVDSPLITHSIGSGSVPGVSTGDLKSMLISGFDDKLELQRKDTTHFSDYAKSSVQTLDTTTFHTWCISCSADTSSFYVDGVSASAAAWGSSNSPTPASFTRVSCRVSGGGYTKLWAAYSTALSGADVLIAHNLILARAA